MKIAVSASSAAFARLAADKWASLQNYCHDRRPGFENQLLYHAREGELEGDLEEGCVRRLDGPIPSIGAQNERWGPSVVKRISPEGKTTTTGGSDASDCPSSEYLRLQRP